MDRDVLVTTEGREVKLRPPSHILFQQMASVVEKQFRDAGEQVDVPQYKAELAGGEVEYHDHDEESIKTASDEEKSAWDAHGDAVTRMNAEISTRQGVFLLREGLVIDQKEYKSGAWIKEQEMYGFEIPEDDFDRFMHYVETVLLKTPADQMNAVIKIQALMVDGVPDNLIEGAEEFFRAQMVGYTTNQEPESDMDEISGALDDKQEMD